MTRYTSAAVRDGRLWRVQADDFPGAISTVTNLKDAARVQREAIVWVAGVPESEVEVEVRVVLPEGLMELTENARHLVTEAAEAQREAAARTREAVAALKRAGLTGADVAVVLGVSPQRVSQLSRAS